MLAGHFCCPLWVWHLLGLRGAIEGELAEGVGTRFSENGLHIQHTCIMPGFFNNLYRLLGPFCML